VPVPVRWGRGQAATTGECWALPPDRPGARNPSFSAVNDCPQRCADDRISMCAVRDRIDPSGPMEPLAEPIPDDYSRISCTDHYRTDDQSVRWDELLLSAGTTPRARLLDRSTPGPRPGVGPFRSVPGRQRPPGRVPPQTGRPPLNLDHPGPRREHLAETSESPTDVASYCPSDKHCDPCSQRGTGHRTAS
jgi:hypothetical protein